MAENPKPSNVPLTVASVCALIAGTLASITDVLAKATDLLKGWPALQDAIKNVPLWVDCTVIAALLILGLVGLAKARGKRSWLRRPDLFNLDPTNPRHLKGRDQSVADLLDACVNTSLVKLTGESGSGKTALVRSGLLPALERDRRLYPLYLDSWGRDWESGPWNALAAVLQRTLADDDRKALGLDHPVTKDGVFPLLASFREKVGRVPLVVFDQFDDYQIAHRSRFRTGRGFWYKPATLAKNNAFWKGVRDLLADPDRPDRLHVLFVTRADAAAGLDTVEFCDSESLPLDKLDAQYLPPLLDELAPADAAPPVVEDPEAGWEQLKKRLARDLQRDGLVLPVQVLAAVRGLTCLPSQVLTVRNYERVGGASGLEAAYVEQSVHKCAQALRGGGLKVGPEGVRRLLLAMVDEKERDKTVSRPVADLVRASGLVDEDDAVQVLGDLERRGLVRRRVSLPDVGGKPAPAGEGWTLYHDYLSRGVTAAERRANRWANLLKESHETFLQAAGSLRGRWRALLSPARQIQLVWNRLRGRFRYGEHTSYAGWSTLRFVPWLLAFAAVACATALAEYEREWWVYKQQMDDMARKQERERLDAEKTASNLLREVAYIDVRALPKADTLWNLAGSSALARDCFWRDALADEQRTELLIKDSKFDLAFHATVGLDPDDEKKRDLADQVVAVAINSSSAGPASTDYYRLCLMARLHAASGFTHDSSTEPLLDRLLGTLTTAKDAHVKAEIARALAAMASKLDPPRARQAFDGLLPAFSNAKDPADRSALARALAAVAGELDPTQARRASDGLLTALSNALEDKFALADALADVADKLDPTQARQALDVQLAALSEAKDPADKFILARALAAVAGRLDPTQARQALDGLLTALSKAKEPVLKAELARALAAVPGEPDPTQRRQAFDGLLKALSKAEDLEDKIALADVLADVGDKLDPTQARQAFDGLLTALTDAQDKLDKARLAAALAAVAGEFDANQLQTLFDILKQPICDKESRDLLLKRLEKESGRDFHGDLSAAARWGREKGLDVTSPPRRELK